MSAHDDDRDIIAAEYALRLLDGRDLEEARSLAGRDAAFAEAVEAWDGRFAPLFDAIAAIEPDSGVWRRIEAAIGPIGGTAGGGRSAEIIVLRRRISAWRNVAGLVTAIAAALALVVLPGLIRPDRAPPTVVAPAGPTMIARVVADDRSTAYVVAYQPDQNELLVTPAIAAAPAGRVHELWLIGVSGVPVSMGVVDEAAPTRLALTPAKLAELKVSATMAVTIEQPGGSPTGQPTSAPIAAGPLVQI